MKKLLLSAALLLSLGLAACGDDEQDIKEEATPATESTEAKKVETDTTEKPAADSEDKTGEVTESELGKMTILYQNKELNTPVTSTPVNSSLDKVQVATLEVSEAYKETFDNQDIVTIITIEATAENTVDETTNFYLDQATLVTDTGQQVDAALFFSDSVGGEFLGKVKKEGNIIWVLKHDEGIKKITLHVDGASNDNLDRVGEDAKVEIALD